MKVHQNKLTDSLNKGISKVYIIFGNESLQIQELVDQICETAHKHSYEVKETHLISKTTDWSFLTSKGENFDIFSSKKIIEVRLIESGPGREGSRALQEYLKLNHDNEILIVTAEGLDTKSKSSVWSKSLEKVGIFVNISPLSLNNLPSWIISKGKENKIDIQQDAAILLAERTEGNLNATFQEIKKLSLLMHNQRIDIKKMGQAISNSTKYNIFDLSNSFISKNRKKSISILESLKVEGTQESLILWAFSRELSNLFKVKQNGSSAELWGPKDYLGMLERMAKTTSQKEFEFAFNQIALIDACIKGQIKRNAWQALREICITF